MSGRRLFVYDKELKRVVEVGADWEPPAPEARLQIMSGSCHEGVIAPDGTPIDTRAKRNAWKKAMGVEDEQDCVGYVAKTKGEREKRFKGEQDIRPYREAAIEAFHMLSHQRGRK